MHVCPFHHLPILEIDSGPVRAFGLSLNSWYHWSPLWHGWLGRFRDSLLKFSVKYYNIFSFQWINGIMRLSHLSCCINSATNFLIYYVNGAKFRKAWKETFGPQTPILKCTANQNDDQEPNTPMIKRLSFRTGRWLTLYI